MNAIQRNRRWGMVGAVLALLAGGCGGGRDPLAEKIAQKNLTADEYQLLKDKDKQRYKDIIVRVPASWGGVLLPLDAYPYASPVDKAVHTGQIGTLMGLYNQSLFELQHPRVKIEYINFDMWTDNFRSALAVALSAKRAPAYYIARDLPQTIEQGMFADLTDLMKKWDQFNQQPEGSIRQGRVNGRIYTLAANELGASVLRYRKDWFREAGIFNERGEPGPRADWTWDDFRAICKKLTDPKKERYGFCGAMSSFLYNEAHNVDVYLPDPTGKQTWIFNDRDPEMLASLQAARDMVNTDKSVQTSSSTGWFESHNEFDGGRAAMISSFAPHIPGESLTSPKKMGPNTVYADTVGMASFPRSKEGYDPLRPITNPIGFDPTLKPDELEAAFEFCKSWFYGDIFINRMRADIAEAKIKGTRSRVYAEVLSLPYKPQENLLDVPLEKVFPADYLDVYKRLRAAASPPLPREFGLREPPTADMDKAIRALYSEAITSPTTDLKQLLKKHADLINTNTLNYRLPNDSANLRRYLDARTEFYRQHFPRYYEAVWRDRLARYYQIPASAARR